MSADRWELLIVAVGVVLSVGMLVWFLRRWYEHMAHCCTGLCSARDSRGWLPRQRTGGES
ncbi:hypothetical protein ACGFZP_12750 [Kitasatospora sp. NPDC048239]|uniref:hypothetical protein n=1 Tax=Kitasatospora sp. NPDC048239 TaxID=3364046 RepID=UPI003710CF00